MLFENDFMKIDMKVLENGNDVTKDHIPSMSNNPILNLACAISRQKLFKGLVKLDVLIDGVEIYDLEKYNQFKDMYSSLGDKDNADHRCAFSMIDAKVAEQGKNEIKVSGKCRNCVSSFELAQERIAALGKVNIHGEWQRSALEVAAKAIEAHARGPEAWDAFVKEQNENGMSFLDVFRDLIALPQEQPEEVFSAVDFAKMIIKDENYKRVLECSDRGDQRFDPEFAKIKIGRREETIANLYREVKQSEVCDCTRRGKKVAKITDPFTGDQVSDKEAMWLYRGLWMTYFAQNPDLVQYAEQFDRFSNINGRDSLEGWYNKIIEAYVKGDRERYVAVVKCSDWYKNIERRVSLDRQIREAGGLVDEKKSSPGRGQEIDR